MGILFDQSKRAAFFGLVCSFSGRLFWFWIGTETLSLQCIGSQFSCNSISNTKEWVVFFCSFVSNKDHKEQHKLEMRMINKVVFIRVDKPKKIPFFLNCEMKGDLMYLKHLSEITIPPPSQEIWQCSFVGLWMSLIRMIVKGTHRKIAA